MVACQVLPPSVLTSSLLMGLFDPTTCIENQYAEVPDLLWRTMGDVMPQGILVYCNDSSQPCIS